MKMLRQIYILKDGNIIYEKDFGKVLSSENFQSIYQEVEAEISRGLLNDFGSSNFFKHRIIYTVDRALKLIFIFIIGFNDDMETVKLELNKLKNDFLESFGDILDNLDPSLFEIFNPLIESIHKNIKTKISLVGFSGVGKTTITKLIRNEEVPETHIPTITGKVSTIKIGKLTFHLWDFAGQEQFSYLWNDFILGSDAVLLITNSTLENVEKSKYFVELIKEQTPNAHSAAIANKQDLDGALRVEKIEEILGIKTYSMVAIEPNNRDKMVQIVADILEMNMEESTLLKPLFERDQLIQLAKKSLENGDIAESASYFDKIADLCLELGDDALYKEFYLKSEKLKRYLPDITTLQEYQNNTDLNDSDSDDDGLTDGQEVNAYFTDPNDPNSDNDGMPDGWEVNNSLNPNVDDSTNDPGGDRLTNLQEYQNDTDPNDSDSDDDELTDGQEVNDYSTDPNDSG
ncbi:hypothetical protein ES703_47046 [subsurface metagenome]|jgi:small GTP-binding protein